MASLSSRQSPSQPTSGRSTITQLGRAQQPRPTPLSSRVAVGQMGVGRRYTGHSDLLTPRQLHLPVPPLPDFARLRADAERIRLQIAAQGGSTATVPAPAPAAPRSITPKEAGYPIPFLSPADQARRVREQKQIQERALAEYNLAAAKIAYLPKFLREAMSKPQVKLQAVPAGPDSFMPVTFWKSQNPTGDVNVGWALCCATVYAMMESFYGKRPQQRYDLVVEHSSTVWKNGYRVHDYYMAAKNSQRSSQALAILEKHMTANRPVMVGVSHTLGMLFSSTDKNGKVHYRQINDGTIDHFVAIVGTGVDKKGKYYRFFDVGTTNKGRDRGTSKLNRLYYNAATGFYEGSSQATGKRYVLTQLRF